MSCVMATPASGVNCSNRQGMLMIATVTWIVVMVVGHPRFMPTPTATQTSRDQVPDLVTFSQARSSMTGGLSVPGGTAESRRTVDNPALSARPASQRWVCVFMSLLAGLSTSIGAMVVFMLPGERVTPSQMAFSLALAAGVMFSVSILEFWLPKLLGHSQQDLHNLLIYSVVGAGAFLLLSKCVPEPDMAAISKPSSLPQEAPEIYGNASRRPSVKSGRDIEEGGNVSDEEAVTIARQWRLSMVLMLSLTLHNFPEGFAVALSALESNRLGLVVMIAIAMHNLPEGICIAVPVLGATGSRKQAFLMATLSGMAEPLGAIVALIVISFFGDLSSGAMENLLTAVGGVMACCAATELLPEALRQKRIQATLAGLLAGFLIMYVTHTYA